MIAKKKSLSRIPKNIVHEKTRLKQLHLAALSAGNESEAEKILDQLAQLEELAQGKRDKGISRENEMFLKVNERNRKLNVVEMREAERRGAEERRRNGEFMCIANLSVINGYGCYGPIFKTKNHPEDVL
jgi:RNA polymerase-associated protein RTF1